MASYDQNLLDEAPKATRAQLQEGYNVDLLEPPRRTPSVRTPPPLTPLAVPLPELSSGSGEKFPTSTTPLPVPKTSFWRTRNGIITIAVVFIVVVGAVVGGAVGGTVKQNNYVPPTASVTRTSSTNSLGPSLAIASQASQAIESTKSTTTSVKTSSTGGQNNMG